MTTDGEPGQRWHWPYEDDPYGLMGAEDASWPDLLERAWGVCHVDALAMMVGRCWARQQPLPTWAAQALVGVLGQFVREHQTGKRGNAASLGWLIEQDQEHLRRFRMVKELRRKKVRWVDVYAEAAEALGLKADAVERSYKLVKKIGEDSWRFNLPTGPYDEL